MEYDDNELPVTLVIVTREVVVSVEVKLWDEEAKNPGVLLTHGVLELAEKEE